MSFNAFAMPSSLTQVLDQLGLQVPTRVQQELFPVVVEGRDVLVSANTGSGKTLAYLLPLLSQVLASAGKQRACTLVVVPTRELVGQLAKVLGDFAQIPGGCKVATLAGGSSINTQLMQLRGGADFILATPGRLLDVIKHNGIDKSSIDVLVLDEADRLLDEGFQDQLDELIAEFRPRQRLMVSATYSRKVRAKAGWILKNPVFLDLATAVEQVRHRAVEVDEQRRKELLLFLFEQDLAAPALIFAADRRGAEKLAENLSKASIKAAVLHGKLSMAQRANVLRQLEDGDLQALVATDLAARGIDVPSLPVVINYDLPRSVELYTHRIGRTARAGLTGEAISLVDINSEAHLALIEKRLNISIPREQIEGFEPKNALQRVVPLNDGNGGIKGKRMSKKDKLRAAAARSAGHSDESDSN
ncbi:DEAD/DEAH box helicase [Granulosicoccus antarcticus]|nr:DEAD/DEAH box helicase [Granulosicoccus antarcticus]